eukprot:595712-Hanusia_phi.AAC.2
MLSRAIFRAGSATRRGVNQIHQRAFGTWSYNQCSKMISSTPLNPPGAAWGQSEVVKHMQPTARNASWSESLYQTPVIPDLLGSKSFIYIPDMEQPSQNMDDSLLLAEQKIFSLNTTGVTVSEPNWDIEGMFAASVLKKRRKKMNKHKWKKRRRLNRSYSR